MNKEISLYDGLAWLRMLDDAGCTWSISFFTYNEQLNSSNGLRVVDKARFRKNYRNDQSDKSNLLLAFTDEDLLENKNRTCQIALIMSINNHKVVK